MQIRKTQFDECKYNLTKTLSPKKKNLNFTNLF